MEATRDSDPKGICSYCNGYFGRDSVKACSRCRYVRYCSKTCQVAAWKTHKPRCSKAAVLRAKLVDDPEANALHTALSKWINTWRAALQTWVLWALDLANHPEDRLATHSMVIQLRRRPNPLDQSLFFEMCSGELMTRNSFLARMHEIFSELSEDMIATVNERRTSDTAQIIILCEEELVRVLWFSLRDGGAQLRQRDPEISRALAEGWAEDLIDAIDAGEPSSEEHKWRTAERLARSHGQ